MQRVKRFSAGWYRTERWMRYWFFNVGAILMCASSLAKLYITPHTLTARLALAAFSGIAYGVMSLSFLYRPSSHAAKK
jgi:hypothetical protein